MSMRNIFIRNATAFKSNISVIPSCMLESNGKSEKISCVVLLGTKEALLSQKFISSMPQYLSPHLNLIKHTVEKTSTKKSSSFFVTESSADDNSYKKVTIGVLPDECSRNNCSTRPDIITKLVRGMDFCTKDDKSVEKKQDQTTASVILGVQVGDNKAESTYRGLIAAIAKGFSHFTSKKRLLDGNFLNDKIQPVSVSIVSIQEDESHEITLSMARNLEVLAESCQMCMYLVDAPPNLLDAGSFASIVVQLAKIYDYKVHTHITGEDLVKENLTGIYNVGKAAESAPKFLVLQHNGKENHMSDEESLVLVGKGIIYDCGGLALKPAASMANMKCDMAGAALVYSTFLSMVRTNNKKNIYAVLCLAENAIDKESYRNDDIIPLHSGLHVEINNTDAEGRLVLADGISFASKYLNPRHIFTLATLTGAQAFATGLNHAGVYANSKNLEDECVEGGKTSGDLIFPLLYCPEFLDEEFASEVADLKNSVKNRNNASSSAAGRFLERSLDKNYKGGFAHFDIASPAFQKDRATGFGVNLLCTLMQKL